MIMIATLDHTGRISRQVAEISQRINSMIEVAETAIEIGSTQGNNAESTMDLTFKAMSGR